MGTESERVTVIFPTDLAKELRTLVPKGQRSRLIVEATRAMLARLKQEEEAVPEPPSRHGPAEPQLDASIEDVGHWLSGLRKSISDEIDRLSDKR